MLFSLASWVQCECFHSLLTLDAWRTSSSGSGLAYDGCRSPAPCFAGWWCHVQGWFLLLVPAHLPVWSLHFSAPLPALVGFSTYVPCRLLWKDCRDSLHTSCWWSSTKMSGESRFLQEQNMGRSFPLNGKYPAWSWLTLYFLFGCKCRAFERKRRCNSCLQDNDQLLPLLIK